MCSRETTYARLAVTLAVFVVGAGCGAGLQQIDKSRPARSGTMSLHPGFSPDPARMSGHAVGARAAEPLGTTDTGPCKGWIGDAPDHYLTLTDRFDYLRVEVVSDADTTLVVEGPDGRFCSDDRSAANRNPEIRGFFREGDYAIWVGTYSEGQEADYNIHFSQSESM